ncbi:UNVERIFIED_CONTAM: Cadmium-induced protein AS8 [Sesamum radiatum]|uniref:Cadmium-induced protein AS8 n=1 Tax=Sesamum radiatum TaxID=300843 RepID=A0AAW2JVH1_SESRA
MIIKSIFRRYERWNPVHPTYGAFWGVGVGIGCGVGWGPGFGPEVIGYVGAGCGAGFSVGITLLGFGIGLPANYLLEVPHSAFTVTRRGALDVARAGLLLGKRSRAGDGLSDIIPHMSDVEQSPCTSSSGFKIGSWTENIVDLADFRSMLVSNTKHVRDRFQRVSGSFFPQVRGKTE